MYFQNDPKAPIDFQHYSCLFSDLLYVDEAVKNKTVTLKTGVDLWQRAKLFGAIAGDLNHDGDFDDIGEDEIISYSQLFRLGNLPLKEVNITTLGLPTKLIKGVLRIVPSDKVLDPKKYWIIEGWRYKILHFVVGDGTGKKPAIYDSIRNGSLTRRNGYCESLRVFELT